MGTETHSSLLVMANTMSDTSSWWKFTATGLSGALISLAGMYVVILPNYATEADVRKILLTESPYLQDRKSIDERSKANSESLNQLTKDIRILVQSNATLSAKMEILINQKIGRPGGARE